MKIYRGIMALAALYNVAFGAWAALVPDAYFRWFELAPPRYPSIWACLGMVIGLYGVAYGYAAWRPDRVDVVVWIGLAGKVLGPLGWLLAVDQNELPPRTFFVILANDLIWWFPFLFYLLRHVEQRSQIVAWLCATFHGVACIGLLMIRGGTEVEPDMAARAHWVIEHKSLWTAVWFAWSLSSMSLLAFFVAWSDHLAAYGAARAGVAACCLVCAMGLAFDLCGESINIACLTRPSQAVPEFARLARWYGILGAGVANGLYCASGLALSSIAWRVGQLRGWLANLGFTMWVVGMSMTFATIFDFRIGMIVTGGATMALFVPWVACVAVRLGKTRPQPGTVK